MRDLIKLAMRWILWPVPGRILFPMMRHALQVKARSLSPEARMCELLTMNNYLANEMADAAVLLGNGSHIKHDLMGYHAFFAERICSTDHVLDIGCGGGELAASIARKSGAKVTAVDNNEDVIARARRNCAGLSIDVVLGDALSSASTPDVTVLVLSNVLEHVDGRPAFLRRLLESTKAERALIRVPLYERDWTVPMREKLGIEWRLDTTHFVEYRIPQFEKEITDAGAKIREMQIRWSEIWAEIVPKNCPSGDSVKLDR